MSKFLTIELDSCDHGKFVCPHYVWDGTNSHFCNKNKVKKRSQDDLFSFCSLPTDNSNLDLEALYDCSLCEDQKYIVEDVEGYPTLKRCSRCNS